MAVYLYYSLVPDVLVASMLPPDEFGEYYATGKKYKSKGQALFFEVDPSYRNPYFEIDAAFAQCQTKPDGTPKRSVYVSMYRVLEHLTPSALGKLYLTTAMGATLSLDRATAIPPVEPELHMYQTLAPINSLVVSRLSPAAYAADVTTAPSHLFRFPGVCFVELGLGALARDPENGQEGDLPYGFVQHLREALLQLTPNGKRNKLVQRVHSLVFPYRMVKHGFYVALGGEFLHYAMPSPEELRRDHGDWWRKANL